MARYANGTFLDSETVNYTNPRAYARRGRAMLADGRTVEVRAGLSDTWFSAPAYRVTRSGRRGARGYVTVETVEGYQTATDADPAVVKFVPIRPIR